MTFLKISALEFSMAGDKYLGRSYEEMDCQAFVERCMADVGYKRDLGGSNSWYRECRSHGWVGSPEDCVKVFGSVPKGALLFILEAVGPKTPAKFRDDGVGDATHMGIVTGRGDGAIHSSSSRGCVATSKFKGKTIPNGGWNRVGMLDVFSYGVERTAGTVRNRTRTAAGDSTHNGPSSATGGGPICAARAPHVTWTNTLVPHSCNESNNSTILQPSFCQGCRPFSAENEHTGSFSGRDEPTGGGFELPAVPPSQAAWEEVARRSLDCARDDTGDARDDTGGSRDDMEEERMTGRVVAETGRTVNLRKKPGGDLIDRINTGSVAEILEAGETWCKVRIGKKEGYMMTEFLITDEGEGSGCYGQDLSTQAQSAFGRDDTGEELLGLLMEVYQGLRNFCERIEEKTGRG